MTRWSALCFHLVQLEGLSNILPHESSPGKQFSYASKVSVCVCVFGGGGGVMKCANGSRLADGRWCDSLFRNEATYSSTASEGCLWAPPSSQIELARIVIACPFILQSHYEEDCFRIRQTSLWCWSGAPEVRWTTALLPVIFLVFVKHVSSLWMKVLKVYPDSEMSWMSLKQLQH